MDMFKMGKEMLSDKLGDGGVVEALSKLTGGGEGALDLGELVQKLQNGGLAEQVSSWLGDGDNADVSGDQLSSALGESQVNEIASALGVDASAAMDKIKNVLPALLDKASSGGSILDNFSGATNVLDLAKNLFK